MKKFILMIMMSLVMVANAQTVHESGVFDNTYITVSAGVINPTTNWNGFDNIRPEFGIEVGKALTTLYTTGLEFTSAVNTTRAKTAFDEMALTWLHKLNVSNAIWGYNPDRKWELQAVGGLGWGHDMVVCDNYGVVQAGLEVAYNLNETWSLLAKPRIEWNHVNDGLNVNHSDLGLAVGVSYKFPNRNGNRGFVVCNEDELFLECNRLNSEVNDLRQRLAGQEEINKQLNEKLKVVPEYRVDTLIIDETIVPTIGFELNSSKLTPATDLYLYNLAQSHKKFLVQGYADAETGNPEYNLALSKKRAEAVKAKLLEYGATEVEIEACGDMIQPFDKNEFNRVAIIVKE